MGGRKLLLWAVVISYLIFGWVDTVEAKSVYAIASHGNGKIKAYYIHDPAEPNGVLTYQATIAETENFGGGAGGLCLWPAKDRMFVTYETVTTITWASIKGMRRNPGIDEYVTGITGGNGLGGMAVDDACSRLYVISRNTPRLYAYDYDVHDNTLVPVPLNETNDYAILEGVGNNGIDIALDVDNSRMFVSNLTPTVRYYNTSTWQLEGSITLGHSAVGIGLDTTRGYLYGGFFTGTGGQNYLMRYELYGDPNSPNIYLEKNLEAPIMDIAVDEDTGYVYLTLKREHQGRLGIVEVYDPTNWISTNPDSLVFMDSESDNDFVSQGPGGIAIGTTYKPPNMSIHKSDNIDDPNYCSIPDDLITYTICYAPGAEDEYNVVVTDRLPRGVDFVSADPDTGYYTERPVHTYTWEIGFVSGGDPNDPYDPNQCLELFVQVNEGAEPLGDLINKAEVESDDSYAKTEIRTPVCCWTNDIIYVDIFATGYNTGLDWQNAYTDLQDALARAAEGCGSEIWVAQGLYSPGKKFSDTFTIPDGVEVYGGFNGTETLLKQRDFSLYTTILSGYVDGSNDNDIVVTMGNDALIDGFVIEEGQAYGVYGLNVDFNIANCKIENNQGRGIYCTNGNLTVMWCIIENNDTYGIYHYGSGYNLSVSNCKIFDNKRDGIYCDRSNLSSINSTIYDNGSAGAGYYGIKLYLPSDTPIIRNNTIVYNNNEGVNLTGNKTPIITNCILWGNDAESDWVRMYECQATYCCIQNPDDPNGIAPGAADPNETGNITAYPQFVDPNNFDYHLGPDSPCIDLGDFEGDYEGEKDIDDQRRVLHGGYDVRVDIGADEYCGGTDTNYADFNDDGYVDLFDYAELANAWLTEPNELNPIYDLNEDEIVSLIDLSLFTDEWLWMACWNYQSTMMMSQSGSGFEEMTSPTQIAASTQPQPQPIKITVEQLWDLIHWLEEIRKTDKYAQNIPEDEWQDFMKRVYLTFEYIK